VNHANRKTARLRMSPLVRCAASSRMLITRALSNWRPRTNLPSSVRGGRVLLKCVPEPDDLDSFDSAHEEDVREEAQRNPVVGAVAGLPKGLRLHAS